MSQHLNRPTGMRAFTMIWSGQLVSLVGTAMTRFALLIWAYEQTGTATTIALIGFAAALPILISPFAGVLIDRYDRRWIMLLTDLGAGISTVALLALFASGELRIWHVFVVQMLSGAFEVFQTPAYTAASTMLMPPQYYARASGMRSIAEAGAELVAPVLAALLLPVVGLGGVMLIDIVTFLFAVYTLSRVRVPHPEPEADDDSSATVWAQMRVGFRFILARSGLFGLMIVMMGMNLSDGLTYSSILPAMILGKTGGSETALATVQAALGIGGIVGGVLLSMRGGPRRRIHGVLLFAALSFFFGDGQLALGDSVWRWALGSFTAAIFIPGIVGSMRAIWQHKTPPALQGRVFAVQSMVQQGARPVGFLLAGPLADQLFEPAMSSGGALVAVFGGLVGTGTGAGIALMFLCTALFGSALSLSGYLFPAIRNVETDLPDYDATLVSDESALQPKAV